MRKWFRIAGLFLIIAVVLIAALFTVASVVRADGPQGNPAQGNTGQGGAAGCPCGMMGNMMGGMMSGMGGANSLVAVAARTLDIEPAALIDELNAGKTIADVAKAKGVAVDKIVDAFMANHQAMMALAVANGHMTQAQVDTQLAVMKANVTAQLSQKFTPGSDGNGFNGGNGLCNPGNTIMGGMMGNGMMNGGMMGGMMNGMGYGRGGGANQGQ